MPYSIYYIYKLYYIQCYLVHIILKTFMFPIAVTFMFLSHNIHVCSWHKPPYTVWNVP